MVSVAPARVTTHIMSMESLESKLELPFTKTNGAFKQIITITTQYDHFVLQYIGVSNDVGGVVCGTIAKICRVLAMMFIYCICSLDLMGVFLWYMYSPWIAQLSVLGSILNSGGR